MPDKKRLGLNSPTDLLAKLDWEISELGHPVEQEQEAIASYRAFNCAITAWSITDWVWNAASDGLRKRFRAESPKPKATDSECFASLLRHQCRELAICQQLANGSKHFVLRDHNDATISSYRSASVSVYLSKEGKTRAVPTYGVFIEDGAQTYADAALFSRARDYWSQFFKNYGVE
jgi:hypothetical protein